MIRSMTGFGVGERDVPGARVRVEVRSVNHKSVHLQIRTGSGLDAFEPLLRSAVRAAVSRGQVTAHLSLDLLGTDGDEGVGIELDLGRAREYASLLGQLKAELGLSGEIELSSLLRFGDVFRSRDPLPSLTEATVTEAVADALEGLGAMRSAEGTALETDLRERLALIDDAVAVVEGLAPARLIRERDRLRQAIQDLMERGEVDEDRLAREIAYLAERWDVNEEIVRLRAHTAAFRGTLDAACGEPVGRRLGFIAQEMHREANTIGSKANDAEIQGAVVSAKEEIDRIKEQVENVE